MVVLLYFARFFSGIPFYTIGAMFGAALGNVSERIFKGYVVDFLDFHIGKYHWPAFNIADSVITVGMIILVSHGLFSKKHEKT
jgi:signal peptidase II